MKEITRLSDIQRYLNEMLRDFKSFCDSNELDFFLEGGTLLGAFRHGGFIPWDDDIDISMLRKDYERMVRILSDQTYLGKYATYSVVHTDSEENKYPYPFAKLIRLDTKLVECAVDKRFESSLYIDIFPIDFMPEEYIETDKLIQKNKRLKTKLGYSVANTSYGNFIKRFAKKIMLWPFRLVGYEKYRDRIISNSKSVKESEYVGVTVWGYGHRGRMLKEDYYLYETLEFEGIEYKVPRNYENHLEKLYGDYKKLPPEEERKSHHNYRVWRKVS